VDGYTLCPDCDSHVNCGTIGLANLEKHHRGKKVCKIAQEKQDKEAKKRKDGSILNFLEPKTAIVPSTVNRPAPVHSYKLSLQSEPDASSTTSTTVTNMQGKTISFMSQPVLRPISNGFIKMLQELVKALPVHVPEASEFDKLAVFGGSPKEFDDPTLDADKLWEASLNSVLKSMLGWGVEGEML
jgi:hypothetical protein